MSLRINRWPKTLKHVSAFHGEGSPAVAVGDENFNEPFAALRISPAPLGGVGGFGSGGCEREILERAKGRVEHPAVCKEQQV